LYRLNKTRHELAQVASSLGISRFLVELKVGFNSQQLLLAVIYRDPKNRAEDVRY
jgi:hypothetical protein